MKNLLLFGLIALILVVAVYAHPDNRIWPRDYVDEMNEVHESMTENADPLFRDYMDNMHTGCINFLNGY